MHRAPRRSRTGRPRRARPRQLAPGLAPVERLTRRSLGRGASERAASAATVGPRDRASRFGGGVAGDRRARPRRRRRSRSDADVAAGRDAGVEEQAAPLGLVLAAVEAVRRDAAVGLEARAGDDRVAEAAVASRSRSGRRACGRSPSRRSRGLQRRVGDRRAVPSIRKRRKSLPGARATTSTSSPATLEVGRAVRPSGNREPAACGSDPAVAGGVDEAARRRRPSGETASRRGSRVRRQRRAERAARPATGPSRAASRTSRPSASTHTRCARAPRGRAGAARARRANPPASEPAAPEVVDEDAARRRSRRRTAGRRGRRPARAASGAAGAGRRRRKSPAGSRRPLRTGRRGVAWRSSGAERVVRPPRAGARPGPRSGTLR